MVILVTGGAGFIGSHFVRYYLGKHPADRIINLDKLTYAGDLKNLGTALKNARHRFVRGDVADRRCVMALAQSAHAIIHFAAETHVDRSIQAAAPFLKTNVLGTHLLLEASRIYRHKRFLYISTDEVYGSARHGRFTEESPLSPNSPYSASKAAAEHLVRAYHVTHRLPTLITRSTNNYGPCQNREKLLPLFITRAARNLPLPLYGDGSNRRDWLYVLDNCEAIDRVFHRGTLGEIYNIGTGIEFSNLEITRKLLRLLGKSQRLIRRAKDRPGHDWRYAVSTAKIRRELGWKPRHRFEETFESTVGWYLNHL